MSYTLEIIGEVPPREKQFDTSNSCMTFIIDQLKQLGVVEAETPRPKFPDRDVPDRDRKCDRILARKSPKLDMVAAYKFSTMDGWVVHPAECKLLASVELAPMDELGYEECPYWEDAEAFTKFCSLAAEHGGFRVL